MSFYQQNRLSSPDKFCYCLQTQFDSVTIVLHRLSDMATKKFFVAYGNESKLGEHMNSLTDDQLDGFFPKLHKTNNDKKKVD